jgi:hypothetical protein
MNQNSLKLLRPVILVYVLLSAFFVIGKEWLLKKGIDQDVVIIGNLLLFVVTVGSFLLTLRSLKSTNSYAFVRGMYSSFLVKFLVIAAAAFVYIKISETGINKPALFVCMGLYIIYTFFEVSTLLRVLKQKKNA